MSYGILGGMLWAVETVVLSIALSMAPFISNEKAIFLAPFVSTFLHDACASIWVGLYNLLRGKGGEVKDALLHTHGGKHTLI